MDYLPFSVQMVIKSKQSHVGIQMQGECHFAVLDVSVDLGINNMSSCK